MRRPNSNSCNCNNDHGPMPFFANVVKAAVENCNYRTAYWTGEHLQMTLMSIPVCGDIGEEVHHDTDQFIRVEKGRALVKIGSQCNHDQNSSYLEEGDGVFIPMNTRHNVINVGNTPLKLTSIYAPPHHPRCTVHRTKEDAMRDCH